MTYLHLTLLIVGVLFLFLGTAPIVSSKYFHEMNEKFWHSETRILSDKNKYLYNRYIRQIAPIVIGMALIIYVLIK